MLTVGDNLPVFEPTACVSWGKGKEFEAITHTSFGRVEPLAGE